MFDKSEQGFCLKRPPWHEITSVEGTQESALILEASVHLVGSMVYAFLAKPWRKSVAILSSTSKTLAYVIDVRRVELSLKGMAKLADEKLGIFELNWSV